MAGRIVRAGVKLPNWQALLCDFITARMHVPFSWGLQDCCLFAADAKTAATGSDPAQNIRGSYSDAKSAARTVRRLGGMRAIGDNAFGSPVDPVSASLGDIGLVENEGRECLAVFGGQFFHAPAERGLTILPVEQCKRAWRLTE